MALLGWCRRDGLHVARAQGTPADLDLPLDDGRVGDDLAPTSRMKWTPPNA